jgi:hypothetical protein
VSKGCTVDNPNGSQVTKVIFMPQTAEPRVLLLLLLLLLLPLLPLLLVLLECATLTCWSIMAMRMSAVNGLYPARE